MTNIQLTPADLSEKAFEIYSNSDFFAEEQKMNKEELIQFYEDLAAMEDEE